MTKLYGFEVSGFGHKNGSVTLKSRSRSLYRFRVCPINFGCEEKKELDNCNCHGQLLGFTIIDVRFREITNVSVSRDLWPWPLPWEYRGCRALQAHVGTIVCKFGSDPAISHGFWDIQLQRYWGHDFDLSGHVTSSDMWCDYWIPKVWFPVGSQYEPTMYLARLSRY